MESEDEARVAYDLVADDYAALLEDELERLPLERAMLTAFVEQVDAVGEARSPISVAGLDGSPVSSPGSEPTCAESTCRRG
ncbi:hypothetical protein ACPPVW_10400 [Leifsonia sp. McL0607]|uniref:hypothetical protein n=1 Tax=Leifsonia sp. McL0607 TaxID=3415672 RepID=UPI003CE88F6C